MTDSSSLFQKLIVQMLKHKWEVHGGTNLFFSFCFLSELKSCNKAAGSPKSVSPKLANPFYFQELFSS